MLYIVALLALAFLIAYFFYGRRLKFVLLRGLAIFFLFLLVFNFSFEFERKEKPRICALFDNSASMSVDWKKKWALSVLDSLERAINLKIFIFGDSLREGKPDWTDRTTIFPGSNMLDCDYVVLVSDGIFKSLTEPEKLVRPLLVLRAPEPKIIDIVLKDVEVPPFFSPDETTNINVVASLKGLDSTSVAVTFKDGKRIILRKKVSLKRGENIIQLSIPPLKEGKHRIDVEIGSTVGDVDTLNNRRSIVAFSRPERRRVLVVSSHPTPLVRLIRGVLENIEELHYDVIVKLDGGYKILGKRVKQLNRKLEGEVLVLIDPEKDIPVYIDSTTPIVLFFEEKRSFGLRLFKMGGTLELVSKEIVPFPSRNFKEWMFPPYPEFPPLPGIYRFTLPDNYKAYLYAPLKTPKGYYPVILKTGRGYIVSGVNFWRIGLKSEKLFNTIIKGMMFDLLRSRPEFIIKWGRGIIGRGEPLYIYAEAYDGEGNPMMDLRVVARAGGMSFAFHPEEPGRWVSPPIVLDRPGTVEVHYLKGDSLLYSEGREIEVMESFAERGEYGIEEGMLNRVARLSGGRVFNNVKGVISFLSNKEVRRKKQMNTRNPIFFVLFLTFITTEWWLRRREGLL